MEHTTYVDSYALVNTPHGLQCAIMLLSSTGDNMHAFCSCQCCRWANDVGLLSLWSNDTRLQLWLARLLLALMPAFMAPAIGMR